MVDETHGCSSSEKPNGVPTLRISERTAIGAWNLKLFSGVPLMYVGDTTPGSTSNRNEARTKRSAAREVPGRDFEMPPASFQYSMIASCLS